MSFKPEVEKELRRITREEVEGFQKALRTCPACKATDAWFSGRCTKCGAYYDGKKQLVVPKPGEESPDDAWDLS